MIYAITPYPLPQSLLLHQLLLLLLFFASSIFSLLA